MNYTNIMEELEKASLFDLYRLQHAISNEIDNPNKIKQIKNLLHEGQIVSHYNGRLNKLEDIEIITMNKNNCVVRQLSNDKLWTSPYASINIDNIDIDINTNQKTGLTKNQIAIGEILTFIDNDNNQRYAKVIRLNQKSVTLMVNNEKWRVGYGLLSKNMDIDGKVIDEDLVIDYKNILLINYKDGREKGNSMNSNECLQPDHKASE